MNLNTETIESMMRNAHGIIDSVTSPPSNDGKILTSTLIGVCANICKRLEDINDKLSRLMPVDDCEAAPEINTNGA